MLRCHQVYERDSRDQSRLSHIFARPGQRVDINKNLQHCTIGQLDLGLTWGSDHGCYCLKVGKSVKVGGSGRWQRLGKGFGTGWWMSLCLLILPPSCIKHIFVSAYTPAELLGNVLPIKKCVTNCSPHFAFLIFSREYWTINRIPGSLPQPFTCQQVVWGGGGGK